MHYVIDCECGESVTVPETAAGMTALCDCGRTVAIPSLRELRSRSGLPQSTPSPEMVVETLLLAGKLPEEDHCVLCGVATESTLCLRTECERAYVHHGGSSRWAYVLGLLTFGWLGAIAVAIARPETGEGQEWGKDRIFPLPLRVCDACSESLTTPAALRAAMCEVPLYRHLLDRFPEAKVTLLRS